MSSFSMALLSIWCLLVCISPVAPATRTFSTFSLCLPHLQLGLHHFTKRHHKLSEAQADFMGSNHMFAKCFPPLLFQPRPSCLFLSNYSVPFSLLPNFYIPFICSWECHWYMCLFCIWNKRPLILIGACRDLGNINNKDQKKKEKGRDLK